MTTGFGNDQGAFELAGSGLVDAEIGRQLHRAMHAFRYIHKGAVTEHCRVECRKEIVGMRHHGAEITLYQVGILANGFGNGTENHPGLGKAATKGRGNGNTVEHSIDSHPGQGLLLLQRDTQPVVGFNQGRIDFIETGGGIGLAARCGVIRYRLKIDGGVMHIGPGRLLHTLPVPESGEPAFQHPGRLLFSGGDGTNDRLIQPGRQGIRLNVGHKALRIPTAHQVVHCTTVRCHDPEPRIR